MALTERGVGMDDSGNIGPRRESCIRRGLPVGQTPPPDREDNLLFFSFLYSCAVALTDMNYYIYRTLAVTWATIKEKPVPSGHRSENVKF